MPQAAKAEDKSLPSGTHDSAIGDALDAFLAQYQGNHAAVATAVFRGNEDVYTRYFGAIDAKGTPLDADCVLEWGSTTKLTVWVSAMQLYEAGKLDLDADIRTYLPEGFLRNLRYDSPVTMLNLMNHNAGFQETDFVVEVGSPDDIIPLGEYLAKYQPVQFFAPGSVVAYSNWGAALAGYVVECIAGVPYWQYVQEHIFAPLEMAHSAIASDLSDNAWVQERRGAFLSYMPDGSLDPDNKVYILPYPAGMCVSTLEDFARFAKALLTRDSRLLSPATFETLFTPSLTYTGTNCARLMHGFLVDYDFAVTIVGHDGNTAGGSSRLLLDLQNNIGMVVLTNQLGGSLYRTKMARLVFGESEYHLDVDGYYVPARNVFSGKHKILYNFRFVNACHITTKLTDGMYFNLLPDRMEISATDYIRQSAYLGDKEASDLLPDMRAQDAWAILWIVMLCYAVLTFLVRLSFAILAAVKKRPQSPLNLLAAVYSLLTALCAIFVLPSVPSVAVLVLTILMGVASLALVLPFVTRKKEQGKSYLLSLIQALSLLLCFAVTVVNVVVWDLALIA